MYEFSSDFRQVTLQGSVSMPTVGFGCAFGDWVGRTDFQGFLPELAWRPLTQALEVGYRAFDGAHAYGTESILGTLMGERFAAGHIGRDSLFLTSKLAHPGAPPHVNISHLRTWDADSVPDVRRRLQDDLMRTLEDLHVGYVDLLLMHWPGSFANTDPAFARATRKVIWETFGEFRQKGATRAVGVSNFTVSHLAQLMDDVPDLPPAVNQVEVHPYCRDTELETFCRENGIVIAAYAPFASGAFDLLEDSALVGIAKSHDVGVGQVILRWHLQSGRTVLPKSSSERRMRQNLQLFDFALSPEEMNAIDALGVDAIRRTCPDPATVL